MTLTISRLTLRNFLSHRGTTVELPRGSIAIVGENGAGKSSMFEAIYFALTTSGWRGKLANLVSVGSSSAMVELTLRDDSGQEAVAAATVERRRDSATSSYRLKVNGKLVASAASAYREEVAKLLGLAGVSDYRGFIESAVIIRQGGLEEIASVLAREDSRRLRELVETAIGIPQLRAAVDNIRSHSIRAVRGDGSVIASFEVGPRRRNDLAITLQGVRKQRQDRLAELRDAEARAKELEAQLREAEAQVKGLEAEVDSLCGPVGALPELEAQLKELEGQLSSRASELKELEEGERELESRIARAEDAKAVASLEPKVREVDALNSQLASLYGELASLRPAVEALDDLKQHEGDYRRYLDLTSELDELKRKEVELTAAIRGAESAEAQARSLMEQAKAVARRLGSALGLSLEPTQEALRSAQEAVNRLSDELEGLRRRAQELQGRLGSIRQARGQLNDITRVLASGSEARCPVCGSPLSPGRREELRRHYEEEAKRLNEEEEEVNRELKELEARATELEGGLRGAQTALGQLAQLLESLAKVQRQDVSGLRAQLKEIVEREEELKEEAKGLERGYSAYVSAADRLSKLKVRPEEAEAVRRRFSELSAKLKEATEARDSALRELIQAVNAKSYDEARRAVEEAVRTAAELPSLKEQLSMVRSRMEAASSEVKSLEARASEVRARLDSLRSQAAMCDARRRALQEARERHTKLAAEAASAKSRAEQLRKDADRAYEDEQALSAALDRLDAALGALSAIERLEKTLYRRALVSLENEMNDVFRVFGLDYARVEVRETEDAFYFTVVDREGRERPIAGLSGGEQIVIALAYVLALNRVMHSSIGFLLLDEPTDMLDDERRRALVDVLGRLTEEGGLQQLIVITHHTDLVDNVDKVCTVEKGPDGFSRVRCEEG